MEVFRAQCLSAAEEAAETQRPPSAGLQGVLLPMVWHASPHGTARHAQQRPAGGGGRTRRVLPALHPLLSRNVSGRCSRVAACGRIWRLHGDCQGRRRS